MAEITYTIDANKWIAEKREIFRKNKKALLYAVTHGYYARVYCVNDDDELAYIDITTPRDMRMAFRVVPFIPRIKIGKNGRHYVIRKGRIVPHRVWPASQMLIEQYEKWLKKTNDDTQGII